MIAILLAVSIFGAVLRTKDGDTIVVVVENAPITVRLVGVDTPETHHPTKPVQRCGMEAEAFTRTALTGKAVRLDLYGKDRYGRTLAYVWRGNRMFNRRLITNGWAIAYHYPHLQRAAFRELEASAKMRGVGQWNPEACKP